MSNLNGLINLSIDSKPRVVWCFDRKVYNNLRTLKDHNGSYILPLHKSKEIPVTLMGIDIEVVDEPACKLKYIFSNGQEISFDYDFDHKEGSYLPSDLMEEHFKELRTSLINAQSFCLVNDGKFLAPGKNPFKRAREIRSLKEPNNEM